MNATWIVRFTNKVALFFGTLLIVWVILFTVNTVFGLKIFREHMTEAFAMSILGILAVLASILMINIMFNLSRIADAKQDPSEQSSTSNVVKWSAKKYFLVLFISLVFIIVAMFVADARTRDVKKSLMLETAQQLVTKYDASFQEYAQKPFDLKSIASIGTIINLMKNSTEFVQNVYVIRQEEIAKQKVSVGVNDYNRHEPTNSSAVFDPSSYVFKATKEQQHYIQKVMEGSTTEPLYHGADGQYWLMIPVKTKGKTLILYLSDYQSYGKLGS